MNSTLQRKKIVVETCVKGRTAALFFYAGSHIHNKNGNNREIKKNGVVNWCHDFALVKKACFKKETLNNMRS
jgi:hypothetical protein